MFKVDASGVHIDYNEYHGVSTYGYCSRDSCLTTSSGTGTDVPVYIWAQQIYSRFDVQVSRC